MRHRLFAAVLLIAGLVAAPSVMAQAKLDVPADAGWKHEATGMIFRAKLGGYARVAIQDNSKSELDVSLQYQNDEDAQASLYIFRPAGGSPSIWFDRSETMILAREIFAGPTPQGDPLAFAPPKAQVASGLRRVYVPGKGEYKSTGLVVMPLGEWLVAIRLTAKHLDASALDAKLSEIIADLGWPDGVAEGVPAVPVSACGNALPFRTNAKLRKPEMMDALVGAAMVGADKKARENPGAGKPITWCREGVGTTEFGVYRNAESTDAYTMAFNDAGIVITVHSETGLDGKKPSYGVHLGLLDGTAIYPKFDGLPTPSAALESVNKGTPVSSISRDGKNVTINMH
jgi:hypothetical protein